MKRIFIICVLVQCLTVPGASAQSGWKYYKYNDLPVTGLSFCIQSDYNGGVFQGLTGGLSKFNGQEWVKVYYNVLSPNSHSNEYNIRVIKISGGSVWTGTNNGIIRFDGYNKKQYNPLNTPTMCDDKIRGIAPDKYGDIWFLNHCLGIFKLDVSADTVVRFMVPLSTPGPFSEDAPMFCDAYDNLWYSAAGKIVKFTDGSVKVLDSLDIPELSNEPVRSIQIRSDNSLAVLMKRKLGIYKDYHGSVSYTNIDVPADLLEAEEMFSMIKVDLEGNLWMLSRYEMGQGISSKHFYKYSKDNAWTKYEFPVFEGTTQNIYALTDFTIDESGKVWFTDPYYGVFVFNSKLTSVDGLPEETSFRIYPNPAGDYLTMNVDRVHGGCEIYSALGVKVLSAETMGRIDVSALPPGLYFIRSGNHLGRFVKNRTGQP
jgi:streptogramin lyase